MYMFLVLIVLILCIIYNGVYICSKGNRTRYTICTLFLLVVCFCILLFCYLLPECVTRERYYTLIDKILSKYGLPSDSLLDFGAGDCTTQYRFPQFRIQSLDIKKSSKCPNLIVYDGTTIPFTDKSFKISLCMFVLHHAINQVHLITELKRVTQKYIIILEDMLNESSLRYSASITTDIHYKMYSQGDEMMSYMHTNDWWVQEFEKHGLSVIENIFIPESLFYPVAHRLYVLCV